MTFASVDDYIGSFPPDVQAMLEQVRKTIRKEVPKAGEKISYNIPVVTLGDKSVIYFAAWKKHLSVYPIPPGDETFEQMIEPYRAAKGTLQFPFRKPIPYDVIKKVTQASVALLTAQK